MFGFGVVFKRFATWDVTATSEDFPPSGCSNSRLSPNRKLFGVVSASEGTGRGFPVGTLSRLRGCERSSNTGGGKPGLKSDIEKCISDLGVLKQGALGLEGCDLAVA